MFNSDMYWLSLVQPHETLKSYDDINEPFFPWGVRCRNELGKTEWSVANHLFIKDKKLHKN